ncbi:hypothetical protein DF3PB_1440005 [uncultured Defluviicoccus sp.]|uniref:Uncharacterized protein n=1 Tax=metagenome TaxID=256318 RepID=A0A380T977_9ZZZZ|nr:hypothetical protein DF3PB_1440005 [uncultured Defluviicoccus sp.]
MIQTEKFTPEMVADLTTKLRTAAPLAIVWLPNRRTLPQAAA